MIQWYAVLVLLLIEMIICLIVVLPVPLSFRTAVLSALAKFWNHPTINIVLKTVFGLLALLFLDALRSINSVNHEISLHHDGHGPHSTCELKLRLFREQRNSYMVGFALFLFLMIYRFKETLVEHQAFEKKSKAVISQSDNAQKEYKRLTEECDDVKKSLYQANSTIADLKKQVASVEAIKKQAENTQKEYMRLLDENDALHKTKNAKKPGEKKDD